MELKCGPCNSQLFIGVLGIFIFCSINAPAQCKGDFSFQSVSAEKGTNSGRIEISVHNATGGTYTFKVYEMNGNLAMVQSKQASTPEKITFEKLKPAIYFVKIEWGESCYRTLGGQNGIIITEKDQER